MLWCKVLVENWSRNGINSLMKIYFLLQSKGFNVKTKARFNSYILNSNGGTFVGQNVYFLQKRETINTLERFPNSSYKVNTSLLT